jgi:hypothetical protein
MASPSKRFRDACISHSRGDKNKDVHPFLKIATKPEYIHWSGMFPVF